MISLLIVSLLSFHNESLLFIYQDSQNLIIDDSFAAKPFGINLLPDNIKSVVKINLDIERKEVVNRHSGEIDSLLIYTSGKSKFYFYKSSGRTFFQRAVITDSSVELAKGIRVGQTQDAFESIYKIRKSRRTITYTITDNENYSQHKFFFMNGELVKIELNAVVD